MSGIHQEMGLAASLVSWLSSLWSATPEDSMEDCPMGDANEVTGLTPGQVKAVQRTFALVGKDVEAFGVDLFMELFEVHPTLQRYFKSFASVPRSDLIGNKRFAAHASTVAFSILNIVNHLDDPNCLVELLLRVGCNHGRRNIKEESFQNLKDVILALLKKKLGNKFTPFVEASWAKTLDVANSVIFKGFEEAKNGTIS